MGVFLESQLKISPFNITKALICASLGNIYVASLLLIFMVPLLLLLILFTQQKPLFATNENISKAVEQADIVFVAYCIPTKENCIQMQPEWAMALEDKSEQIGFLMMDCTLERSCPHIQQFPTIKVFRFGKEIITSLETKRTYHGWLEVFNKILSPFVNYTNSQSPKIILLNINKAPYMEFAYSLLEADFIDGTSMEFILLGNGTPNKKDVAVEEGKYYSYDDENICLQLHYKKCSDGTAKYLIPSTEGVIILKPDEKRFIYFNQTKPPTSAAFFKQYLIPFTGSFNKDYADAIFIYEKTGIVLFRSNNSQSIAAEKIIREVANLHKDLNLFTIADPEEDLAARMFGYLGFSMDEVPLLVAVNFEKIKRKAGVYQYSETLFTAENVNKFITDWKNGLIKRRFKSEKVPTEPQAGLIKKVVSKNFYEEVLKTNKDVMVKFFSPGCWACKKFQPVYEKLAKTYKDLNGEKMEFVEVNILSNEIEGQDIHYYPTIKLFAAGKKDSPLTFSGKDKSFKNMVEFIKNSCSVSIEHPSLEKVDL